MRLAVLALLTALAFSAYSYRAMLGGFSTANTVSNDAGVEAARKAVADKLSHQLGRPVRVEVLAAQAQVVAGMNYRLTLRAADSHVDTKYYTAQVWAKLPAHGGGCEVTKLEEVSAAAAGAAGGAEGTDDPEVDAAAAYAVQQLSAQSNSLFPFQLAKVLAADKTPGTADGGDASDASGKEGQTHHLKLLVRQGSMPEQTFEVDVAEAPHGHVLKSSKQLV